MPRFVYKRNKTIFICRKYLCDEKKMRNKTCVEEAAITLYIRGDLNALSQITLPGLARIYTVQTLVLIH